MKKTGRKILAGCLTASVILALTACNNAETAGGSASGEESASTEVSASAETAFSSSTAPEAAVSSVSAYAVSTLRGEGFTDGNTTIKAEDEHSFVSYDENTSAQITLTTVDGTAADASLIDISEAYVTLDKGDGYYPDQLTFNGTKLAEVSEDGTIIYRLNDEDIVWNQPEGYTIDNGGMEWSALGGDGSGTYTFNLTAHNIKYAGEVVEDVSFRAAVYIYGREFTATKSPKNPAGSRWGAGGYDKVELPLPEETPLETVVDAGDTAVWTWAGNDTYGMPILCDYSYSETDENGNETGYYSAVDNFYVSWPEGIDASALAAEDVVITLYSNYGDEYVLTPNTGLKTVEDNGESIADGEYSVFVSEDTTQIAVNMVYWDNTPVYTTMKIEVNTADIENYDAEVSYETPVGSVYTYMVQTGGGLDYEGTVIAQTVYGIANIDDITLKDVAVTPDGYYFAYSEGEGRDAVEVAYLVENEDGTYSVTGNIEEAAVYEDDEDIQLIGRSLVKTEHPKEIEAEYNGETVTFAKAYAGRVTWNNVDLGTTKLIPEEGYVLTAASWDDHQRSGWLYFNGKGWIAENTEK